jgi:hypothetical protein
LVGHLSPIVQKPIALKLNEPFTSPTLKENSRELLELEIARYGARLTEVLDLTDNLPKFLANRIIGPDFLPEQARVGRKKFAERTKLHAHYDFEDGRRFERR